MILISIIIDKILKLVTVRFSRLQRINLKNLKSIIILKI